MSEAARDDLSLRFQDLRFIQCADCNEIIAPPYWAVRTLSCRHNAHRECSVCRVCNPDPVTTGWPQLDDALSWALGPIFNVFGAVDAYMGRYRRSVMIATSFGLLWALGVVLVPLRKLTGIDSFELSYVIIMTWRWGSWVSFRYAPECVAVASCWVAGRFGFEWKRGSVLDAVTSFAAAVPCVLAFRHFDEVGSLITMFYVFRSMWTWPTIWSFHPGNCCGAGTFAAFWVLVTFFTSVVVSSVGYIHFKGATVLHAWFLCGALFPKQTKDPFDRRASEFVRSACSFAALVFFQRSMRHNSR